MIDGNDVIGIVKKVAMYLIAALLLMLVSGLLGGIIGYDKGKARCEELQPDTITITRVDTVTLVEEKIDSVIRYVSRLYPVAVHDTTTIVRHTTDSIFISLPYEYHYYAVPDTLEVWYSGVDPKIDSAKVYAYHTTEIIKQPYDVWRMPRLTADIGVAAFYHEKQVFPLLVGEIAYNAKHTTFSAIGGIDHQGRWGAGASVTYRFNLVK